MKAKYLAGLGGRARAAGGRRRGVLGAAAVAALALLAMAACGGCIWLAVPSLAYQGFKAEQPANQATQSKPRDNGQQSGGDQYE